MTECENGCSINQPLRENASAEEVLIHAYYARNEVDKIIDTLCKRHNHLLSIADKHLQKAIRLQRKLAQVDQQLSDCWLDYLCSGATHNQWLALVQSLEAE